MPVYRRFIEFFGLKKSIAGLLCMVLLIGMGEKMSERFLPVYLMALGGGALGIGLLNGLNNLLSALYSFPGGYLSERIGPKKSLLVFNIIAILGFLIVILVPHWIAVIVGACFFLSWTAVSLPATMSLIADILPKNKRTMGVTVHSLIRRIPMALGPVLGGMCIEVWGVTDGIRIAFVIATVLALVATVIQQILIEEKNQKKAEMPEKNPLKFLKYLTPPLRMLLVSDILVRFCEQIPYAFVVIWCMKTIAHPVTPVEFGLLTTVEMTTAVLVYIPVAYLADKTSKKPFVIITFAFFTLFPLSLLFCHSFMWLLPAFVLRGLKEFGEPTRKAMIMDLAPEGLKASVFGLYYLIRDTIVSLAAFGGAFLWELSPSMNFIAAFIFGMIGTVGFAIFGKDMQEHK
ncbi:MAG: MFS transporter [Lentisphaerae bacterium GWF2_44_16]|nr:MAG: MFS transporter [Lentisphaerae bacterium GWF2_44_16]